MKDKNKKLKPEKIKKDTKQERKEYAEYCKQKFEEFNHNGKLTVALFCDTYFPIIDGVINVLDNYAKRLGKYCNVVVFVPSHAGKQIKSEHYLVYSVKSLYFKFVNYDLAFPKLDKQFKKLIKNLKIDIIHSHSPFTMGSFAAKLAKQLKIPYINHFHSQYKQDFYKNTKSNLLTKMLLANIMKVFNKSTEVWTMHQKALELVAEYGYKGSGYLIPNATDFVYSDEFLVREKEINDKYNLHNQENVFLFVGRLVEQKNIFFIVDALKQLKEKNIPFKMIFIGNGPDENRLVARIEKLGLSNDVILAGKIMDKTLLGGFFKRANLFLFPSIYDTDGIVKIEASCCDTASVVIKDTLAASTITADRNGFVAENTVDDFANKVIEAISDKENLKCVTENAKKELYIVWDEVVERAFNRYVYLIEENKKK